VVVHRARSVPYLVLGWLWYLGTLLPVSGLIQVGGHAMADRYAYLPLIGVFILLVWGGWGWLGNFPVARKWGGGALLCLFVGMAMTTATQLSHWQSSVTLFEHVIRSTENNHLAHNNLGIALLEGGRMEEAAAQFAQALKIKPGNSTALFNLGLTMKRRGETEEAERYFLKALVENPNLAVAHNNLGIILDEQGSSEEAFQHFRQAVELDPRLLDVFHIGPDGQQSKEGTQHVFPLGNPGHRFHVERMQTEESGHQRAWPQGTRHQVKHPEKKHSVSHMDHQTGDMMSGGLQAKKLAVCHVRDPGERMPESSLQCRQRPSNIGPAQATLNSKVVQDVQIVIQIDKPVFPDGRVHNQGRHDQKQGDQTLIGT